mmetsp:Transcript_19766/g.40804  ORF Transcript_19766/g.40804 Transcript_19766/m.40804 type:complete len:287 (-) Transcript_19766:280-1140(-)
MEHAQFRMRAEHVVRIHTSEAIANVVDNGFDGFRQKRMTRGGRNKPVPQTHSTIDGDARFVLGYHESDVRRDRNIEICLEHDVHIGIHTAMNQQHAIAKQIGLEGSRSECFVGLSNFRWKMRAQKVKTHFVGIEFVMPSRLLEGFDEATHVWIFLGCDFFKIGLVDDAWYQPGRILGVKGWADHERLGDEFFLHGYVAESLAVTRTNRSTRFAVRTVFVAQTITAFLVGGQTIVLQQGFKEIRCEVCVVLWFRMDPFGYRRYVRKIEFVVFTGIGVQRLWQVRRRW